MEKRQGSLGALPFCDTYGEGRHLWGCRYSRKQGGSGALRRPGSSRLRAGALGYGQAVRCSLNGQAMLAYEPDLRFLCRNRTSSAHRAGWFKGELCMLPAAAPPLVAGATTFLLKGSMSLDSQSPTAPYESSSFATPQAGAQQPVLKLEQLMICQARGALLSTVHILHRMCKLGEVRRLACP